MLLMHCPVSLQQRPKHVRWYSRPCSAPLCPHATLDITIACSRNSPKPACSPSPAIRTCVCA
eukprot:11081029-Alexandrium_andersonii.AAC.1